MFYDQSNQHYLDAKHNLYRNGETIEESHESRDVTGARLPDSRTGACRPHVPLGRNFGYKQKSTLCLDFRTLFRMNCQ